MIRTATRRQRKQIEMLAKIMMIKQFEKKEADDEEGKDKPNKENPWQKKEMERKTLAVMVRAEDVVKATGYCLKLLKKGVTAYAE